MLGEATFIQVVRDQRAELMARIRDLIDKEAGNYGIQVVDVRIRRADLPEQNSQAVYQRMQTERQREAAEYRAQGAQRAQEIRSRADREVTVLVAEATSKSEQIRGEGDATRNQIFAEAFGQDPDFFAFYRSMQAYEAGLKPADTRLLLKPDTSFFRFFNNPSGKEARPSRRCRRRPRRGGRRAVGVGPLAGSAAGMSDFLAALGLVFVIEGLMFAAFPAQAKRAMTSVLETPETTLRVIGLGSALIGLVLVWLVRG